MRHPTAPAKEVVFGHPMLGTMSERRKNLMEILTIHQKAHIVHNLHFRLHSALS